MIDFQISHNLFQYSHHWILLLHWSLQYIRLKWSVQCPELQSIAVLHRFCSVISSCEQQSSGSSQYSLYFFWESSIPYSNTMASTIGLTETGPKMDWTRDAKIYNRYLNWKTKVELIFNSVLSKATSVQKSSYIDCGWVTQASPSSGSGRTQDKYPLSMPKLQKVVKYPMATNWKPFGIYSMRSWYLKGTNYFQWLNFGLRVNKGQNHSMNGWPMYTTLQSYVTNPQPPRKESSGMF